MSYILVPGDQCRCWYAATTASLAADSAWRIHELIRGAVKAVPDIAAATMLGFPGADGADSSQLRSIKKSFLTSDDFTSASWGGDMEMHLLSYAYGGAIQFVVYRERLAEPTTYRYTGDGCVDARIEIALHMCCMRPSRRESTPNHYNLLEYVTSTGDDGGAERAQPFWWVEGESEEHQVDRRAKLRQAVVMG